MNPQEMQDLQELLGLMTPEERAEVAAILAEDARRTVWRPLPGPQTMAVESEADVVGLGGSAGGGKTDAIVGMALTGHQRVVVFRREKAQLEGVIQRMAELVGNTDGYNSQKGIWRVDVGTRPLVEFGGLNNPGDESRFQGRPHDLLCCGAGTPVWMADGSRKAIEDVRVGDSVQTLSGPHRVTRTMQVTRPAVELVASDAGGEVGRQVQGATHELLTFDGAWIADATEITMVAAEGRVNWPYVHPYTGGREVSCLPQRPARCEYRPQEGSTLLFDLTVEGANHYITGPGFVNRNCYDEVTEILESQVRFTMGWARSNDPTQRARVLMTFNPPTTTEGRWVVAFFAPWLDPKHPNPAMPGELRWFTTLNGKDAEVPDNRPFVLKGTERLYDFDPKAYAPEQIIRPKSRTFIPARLTDNPYYMATGYMEQLQALPEPLRSQMLLGDFNAGVQDDPFQVCPTAWVEAAMARWHRPPKLTEMQTIGVDVARGGKDNTVIARRHADHWYDEPLTYPGAETPNGQEAAARVIAATRDSAPSAIDAIGVGAAVYDFLVYARQQSMGVVVSESATAKDKSGLLEFANIRTQLWWQFRELLDPSSNSGICLPPDQRLKADLCAPKWGVVGRVIAVESREQIVKRIGRSPDFASAYLLAAMEHPKRGSVGQTNVVKDYDPLALAHATRNHSREYDPFATFR